MWTLLEILLLDGVGLVGGLTGLVKFVFRLFSVLLAGEGVGGYGGHDIAGRCWTANDLIKKY